MYNKDYNDSRFIPLCMRMVHHPISASLKNKESPVNSLYRLINKVIQFNSCLFTYEINIL
jgi:hypothetical protein